MPGMPPLGMQPPDPMASVRDALMRIAKAIGLLRNEKLRGFRVDIEVDSTIYGDAQQEKGDRTQFIASVTQFLGQAMAILLGKMLQFGVRGFRVGRDLEAAIEEFCDEAAEKAKKMQMMPKPPSPLQIKAETDKAKAQAQIEATHAKTQRDNIKAQVDVQTNQAKAATEAQKGQAELERQRLQNQGDAVQVAADMQMKQSDLEMRKMELEIERLRLQLELARLTNPRPEKDGQQEAMM